METSNIPTGSQQPTAAPQQETEASLEPELFNEDELLDASADDDDHSMPADAFNILGDVDPIYAVRFTRKSSLDRPCPLAPGVYGKKTCAGYLESHSYVYGNGWFIVREDMKTLNDLVERLSDFYDIGDEYCYIDRIYYSPSTRCLIVCDATAEEARARREAASDFR